MIRVVRVSFLLTVLLLALPVLADDLSGSDQFLCTVMYATECQPTGDCAGGPPWGSNIPHFIEVDLAKKTLGTTKASGENRSTKIKNLDRDNGLIVLQGYENERAFSFLITEATGFASISVAKKPLKSWKIMSNKAESCITAGKEPVNSPTKENHPWHHPLDAKPNRLNPSLSR